MNIPVTRPAARSLRTGVVLAAGLAIGAGGWALASSPTKTVHACIENKARLLLVQSRCGRGQTPLVFNQQGPRGETGSTGTQGPPAAAAWARIISGGLIGGDNITVQRDSTGVYTLTAGGPCTTTPNPSEVVTPSLGSVSSSGYPVAYVVTPNGPGNTFQVVTGDTTNGVFTPFDVAFSVAVYCNQS
jgi:hypothetical protein